MSSATLKGELKAFEKEFKAQHGRAPLKEDIKARPDIASKYKAYNNNRAQPSSTQPESSSNAHQPTPPVPGPSHDATPRKSKSASNSLLHSLGTPQRATTTTTAPFGSRSPAKGKAPNPFAAAPSPAKDTPRTNARMWLSGQAKKTPDAKKQLFKDWKNASVLSRPLNAASAAGHTQGVVLPDKKLFQAPAPPAATQAGPSKAKSTTTTTAASGTTRPASIFFDPTQQQQRRPFEAERKRPTSPGAAGSDTDRAAGEANEGPLTKRPKLRKRPKLSKTAKGTTTTTSKGKGTSARRSGQRSQSDVTMADDAQEPTPEEEDEDKVGTTSRRLADGSVMMSFRDAGGNVHEMRVRDYLTSRRGSSPEEYDLDYDYDHQQQSSAASSIADVEPTADMPAHLVSLLSLNGSPNKKHRREIARTKEQLYKRVLQEPSLQAPAASGLLELAQEHEEGESALTAGGEGDDEAEGAEGSGEDDDWESEPEGWKELGGEDLMGLDV